MIKSMKVEAPERPRISQVNERKREIQGQLRREHVYVHFAPIVAGEGQVKCRGFIALVKSPALSFPI
jgi:hypothetical protein